MSDNRWAYFDEGFFEKHQRILLFLLNNFFTKRWFRWVMRIRHHDCPLQEKITQIGPNRFSYGDRFITDGLIERTTDFKTHWKFSKRLYFAFKPFWLLLHAWDMFLANQLGLAWSFGFDTLKQYPDPGTGAVTVDGDINSTPGGAASYASHRGAAGTLTNASGSSATTMRLGLWSLTSSPNYWWFNRGIQTYDTSSLGSSANISNAVISFYNVVKADTNTVNPESVIVSANPASNNNLVDADYQTAVYGTTELSDTRINTGTSGAYLDRTLNASGRNNINKTGITKFGFMVANDLANSDPGWYNAAGGNEGYSCDAADAAGISQDPKLTITYTAPAGLGEIPASSSLRVYYRLRVNAADYSGNGNNGASTNITYGLTSGKFGQGASFNGTSSKITLPVMNFGSGPLTASVWIKTTINGGMRVVTNRNSNLTWWSFHVTTNAVAWELANNNPTNYKTMTATFNYYDGVWHHLAGVIDGSNLYIYADGKLIGSDTWTPFNTDGTVRAFIGVYSDGTNFGEYFNGSIDEVILEASAWSAAKIRKYYTQARGRMRAVASI